MPLDTETLSLAGAFVAITCGIFLSFIGWRFSSLRTTGVWGASAIMASAGMALFATDDNLDLGFLCTIFASALSWLAAARFSGERPPLLAAALAGLGWLVIAEGPFDIPLSTRLALYQFTLAFLMSGAAWEFGRSRGEGLRALSPMAWVVAAHGLVFLIGGAATLFAAGSGVTLNADMFAPVSIEVIVFSVGSSIIFIALIAERGINTERSAARIDWLTGLLNRGGFVEKSEGRIADLQGSDKPVSAILFDLDHFKAINDSFGHAAGDAVLQRFAAVAAHHLRRSDVIGRIGGEEFAVLLPDAGRETAMALADRIREAFCEDCKWVDGVTLNATTSAGIAVARSGEILGDLLAAADGALYVAKQGGRDRIAIFDERTAMRDDFLLRFA